MYGEIEVTQEVKVKINLYEMKVADLVSALYEKYINAFPAEQRKIEEELTENFPNLIITSHANANS